MKPYLVLAAILCGALSNAQTIADNYIELSVSDTLPLKVKSISYSITPQDQSAVAEVAYDENTDYDKVQKEAQERATKLREKLEKDLKAQGYVIDPAPAYGDPYTISSYDGSYDNTVRVLVKNETELKALVDLLRKRGGVDGSVGETKFDDQTPMADAFIAGLFQKAKARAQRVAELGGRKLGKLLLAHDPQQDAFTFQDFIRMMDRHEGNDEAYRMAQARVRSMVFRFALTD